MKCPYRKVIFNLKSMGLDGTEENFAECYKEECPCYVPERQFGGGIVEEYCLRCQRKAVLNEILKENVL